MDPSLFTAAVEGNTKSLLKLLRDDPLILERVSSAGADTPLHISAMLGHLPFVKELIKHKIDVMNFILELNQHGFSAVHMASANGHIEVVTELLKVAGPRAVNLKGKDGTTPLHCACVKGKAAIVSHLLEEYGDVRVAISEATVRRENSLHLAMKNNQFQVLEVLVEKIKMNNLFELLNSKDEEGNTALHLAAARRNRQAIELLLRCYN